MRNRQLHNMRAFLKHNPDATVSDFARDQREARQQVQSEEKAYEEHLRAKGKYHGKKNNKM